MKAGGLLLGGAALAAIAYFAFRPAAGPPSGGSKPPTPPPGNKPPITPRPPGVPPEAWRRATVLLPNKPTRLSIPVGLLAPVLLQTSNWSDALRTWAQNVPSLGVAGGAFAQLIVWGPTDPRPADWPTDDPYTASSFGLQYVTSLGLAPVDVSQLPPGQVAAWQYL